MIASKYNVSYIWLCVERGVYLKDIQTIFMILLTHATTDQFHFIRIQCHNNVSSVIVPMLLMMMIRKIIIIFCLLCMYVCSLLYSNLPISREKSVCVPFCFGECEHYDMTLVPPLLLDYMTKMLKLQYMYFSFLSRGNAGESKYVEVEVSCVV